MRIALLAPFPLAFVPGLEREPLPGNYATWLPQLSQAFSELPELELHWLIYTRKKFSAEPICRGNQSFHLLHNPGRLRLLRGYGQECRLARACLAGIRPDLVHAWGTEYPTGFAAARAGWPWLLSMQGILLEYLSRCRMHPLVYVQAVYEWLTLRRARQISVESHWGAAVMRRRAPQAEVHLVEYGVQPVFFETPWQPDPTRPVALFAGTPDGRKGIQDAIAAFADPALAGFELQIAAGDESAFARKLKRRATPNVRWLGRLSPAELATALSRAWCLVLPTRADTSPNVVKEARVIGLPVVTTPHGGQSDYIFDGENGFLVEPGDIAALTRGLRTLLSDLETARKFGARRHAEQREFFRPARTAAGFLKLYRELCAKSG